MDTNNISLKEFSFVGGFLDGKKLKLPEMVDSMSFKTDTEISTYKIRIGNILSLQKIKQKKSEKKGKKDGKNEKEI